MGFLKDRGLGALQPGTLTSMFDPGDLGGTHAASEAKEALKDAEDAQLAALGGATEETRRSRAEAQAFLAPFGDVGLQGVEQAGFLTDPKAQFEFLQSNPLFALALENANTTTDARAASQGRVSAGDTLTDLSNNVLLSASPLITQQKNSISDLLNFGSGIARSQANTSIGEGSEVSRLIESRGDVQASGLLGANQIAAQTTQNRNQLAGQVFAMFSDERLKDNVRCIGKDKGYNIYSWTWNGVAEKLGLTGESFGVMAQEIERFMPDAIGYRDGFKTVDYGMVGVKHG